MSKLSSWLKRCFEHRKLVVISSCNVHNISLSSHTQLFFMLVAIGLGVWMSFSTGMYFAHSRIVEAKDARFHEIEEDHIELTKNFALIYTDLKRLSDDLSPEKMDNVYNAFLHNQHKEFDGSKTELIITERMTYLESRLDQLEHYRASFLDDMEVRTEAVIDELEGIIRLTKLPLSDVIENARKSEQDQNFAATGPDTEPQGGPFIGVLNELYSDKEQQLVDNMQSLTHLAAIVKALPMAEPMENARRTSGYGMRRDPFTKRRAMHSGVDFAGKWEQDVMATAPGVVTYSGKKGAYGLLVEIDHDFGIKTRYGHLSSINIAEGRTVERGQVIGRQGSTGRSTGQHLHYEVRFNGRARDPKDFLEAGEHVLAKK